MTNKKHEVGNEAGKQLSEVERKATKLLLISGFKSSLSGTEYLQQAIVMKYTDNTIMCKDIYFIIAQQAKVSVESVQSAIRHAIKNCFDHGNMLKLNEVVACEVLGSQFVPTNNEFICAACQMIKIYG